jgi:tRNA threonylcarbamoyladenosine biosynthesis protein TsaE
MAKEGLTILSHSADETRAVGRSLGELAQAGDLFSLLGDLGAGKTALAQGILQGLGVTRPVTSPTFNIVNEYHGRVVVYHLDLYRLEDPAELLEIGLEEMLQGEAVLVIEWGDRFADYLPAERLEIILDYSKDPADRLLTFRPLGRRYRELVDRLQQGQKLKGMC